MLSLVRLVAHQMTQCMCPKCKELWNDNPLGVLRRRDLCKECFQIVEDFHRQAVQSSKGFYYKAASTAVPPAASCAATFASTPDDFDARRATHEDEISNRVRWCLDHNMAPAYDFVHLAPGDDQRFMVTYLVFFVFWIGFALVEAS